jgi:hypothetical protein
LRLDHSDRRAALASAGRKFKPDESAADNDDACSRLKPCPDGNRVLKTAQGGAMFAARCEGQRARNGTCRKQKTRIGDFPAILQCDALFFPVD